MKLIERVHGDNPDKAKAAVKVLDECKGTGMLATTCAVQYKFGVNVCVVC